MPLDLHTELLNRAAQVGPAEAGKPSRMAPIVSTAISTAVPPLLQYIAGMKDWNTSQPFFKAGWNEHNPDFTQNHTPDSAPLNYEDGAKAMKSRALHTLGSSAVNAVGTTLATKLLERQFPAHKKLIGTLGLVGQAGLNGLLSYNKAAPHFKQVGWNKSHTPTE